MPAEKRPISRVSFSEGIYGKPPVSISSNKEHGMSRYIWCIAGSAQRQTSSSPNLSLKTLLDRKPHQITVFNEIAPVHSRSDFILSFVIYYNSVIRVFFVDYHPR
jgi:hypothetical protein